MLSIYKETNMTGIISDRSNAIYIKNVSHKGRGVFANIPFKNGDLIDRSPTWGFGNVEATQFDNTGLFEYYFVRPSKFAQQPMVGYVVFGFISIVNHSSRPNARIAWADEDTGTWASIIALKDIKVGDEITHQYSNISDYPKTIKFVE
ncbi:SET domain-containing protein-lysine N-methyltransferase [Mesorhizobium sp.]|uniref:SET domain-containing protein-lysine N-methyltransferase n=2 Tax=Mesorhizobium sp. TaxID=1871066 RepID=UPI0025F7130B|nr:SET domain-containing protein-lysine N-methyltransferase [Mesorhizobium sp.]